MTMPWSPDESEDPGLDDNPPPMPSFSDPIRSRKKRDPGEIFATVATGVILGGALIIVMICVAAAIVWLFRHLF